jgi:hypothetical protein
MPAPLEAAHLVPDRRELAALWRSFTAEGGRVCLTMDDITGLTRVSPAKYCACMRIFNEAGLTEASFVNDIYTAVAIPRSGKADLNSTPLLRHLRRS